MGYRSSRKFVLTLQPVNGGGEPLKLEVTPNKVDKLLNLLAPEMDRKEQATKTPSATLEKFFTDEPMTTGQD